LTLVWIEERDRDHLSQPSFASQLRHATTYEGRFLEAALETAHLLGHELSLALWAYTAAEVADALETVWTCAGEDGGPLHIAHRAVLAARPRAR
jgi:hypothetical protein